MKKEEAAALIMAAVFLVLPDVGLTKAQAICMLIVLYGFSWSLLTWIEIRKEEHEKKKKRLQLIRRVRERGEKYAV